MSKYCFEFSSDLIDNDDAVIEFLKLRVMLEIQISKM